jgi:hypothetical protein
MEMRKDHQVCVTDTNITHNMYTTEQDDYKDDGSLSPGSSCHSLDNLSLAAMAVAAESQSHSESGPSSTSNFQTQTAELQSQTAQEENKPRKSQLIPIPVPIADFVLKFYRYVN